VARPAALVVAVCDRGPQD